MVKGASIKFSSYAESVPKLLGLLKLDRELKKYDKIVLKPWLDATGGESTPLGFVEEVLKFCLKSKNPVTEVFIAEGADGEETNNLFDLLGYKALAEKYSVSLIDLNEAETEEVENFEFAKFSTIQYPKLLKESFVISLPKLGEDEEAELSGALRNMLGAYPSDYYSGFFSKVKKKIKKWPIKYAIHDIIKVKMPDFAVIDASEKGVILAGLPFDMDKQSAKMIGKEWKDISHLKLIEKSFEEKKEEEDTKIY